MTNSGRPTMKNGPARIAIPTTMRTKPRTTPVIRPSQARIQKTRRNGRVTRNQRAPRSPTIAEPKDQDQERAGRAGPNSGSHDAAFAGGGPGAAEARTHPRVGGSYQTVPD